MTWVCGCIAWRHSSGARWVVQAMMLSTSMIVVIRNHHELNMPNTPSRASGSVQPRNRGLTWSSQDAHACGSPRTVSGACGNRTPSSVRRPSTRMMTRPTRLLWKNA